MQAGPDERSMILVLVHEFLKELKLIWQRIPFPTFDIYFQCKSQSNPLQAILQGDGHSSVQYVRISKALEDERLFSLDYLVKIYPQ